MKTPKAKKIAKKITQHGYERIDNYAWMRDDNWKEFILGNLEFKNKEVLDYIDDENEYKKKCMLTYQDVEKKLYDEILSRIKEDDQSFPEKRDDYFYYSREEKGKNYSFLCRKFQSLENEEEVYFDINKEAKGHKLYDFGPCETTENNKYLVYFYNLTGSLEKTLKVRDLSLGEDLDWEIKDCTGSFELCDDESLYYVEKDEFSRGQDIYKINIQEGPSSKKLVFSKPKKYSNMFLWLDRTGDKEFYSIYLTSGATQVLYNSKSGSDHFDEFIIGENDIQFSIEHYKNNFYILTNVNDSPDFKVMICPDDQKKWSFENWKIFLEETPDEYLSELHIYNKYLVLVSKNNKMALNEISVCDIETRKITKIKMPNVAYDLSFLGDWDYQSTLVQMGFNSPINPYQTLQLDLNTKKVSLLHEKECPHFDSDQYVVKREMATSRDGEEVPITLLHKKGLKKNGKNKVFIYSYGSYGFGMPAYFKSSIFSLIDRGFIYCLAHIRGGDDKGFNWYLDGKMHKKMNTFYDFIDCCDYLIKEKYTAKGLMIANGGSAGGLLMGAVTNLRPDLFGCVIADVPFVDVINTISDESLPLTPPEWEEWGNPIESKEDFDYMMKYSPYDNIKKQDYPPMLYNSGISDEQVTYWEPTKMVAKLRELKTDSNDLFLNMKMHAGHAGASKKYEWIEEVAFNYAFILKSFNLR